jgi:hypothetical protein
MDMKYKYLIVLLFSIPLTILGQGISLNVSQDARLALIGDERGNNPFTANVNVAAEFRGWQKNNFYFVKRIELEYADLKGGGLYRMTANYGMTFNKWVKDVDFTVTVGGGMLSRHGLGGLHTQANLQTTWYFTEGVGLFLDSEFVQRIDLPNKFVGYSGKVGIKIILR